VVVGEFDDRVALAPADEAVKASEANDNASARSFFMFFSLS
jgi:hypothetical protein